MGHDGTANESCKFRGSELMIWVQGTCVIHPKDKGQYCRSVYTAQTKIEEQIVRMQAYAHERMYSQANHPANGRNHLPTYGCMSAGEN